MYEIIITPVNVWLVLEYCPNDELYGHLIQNGKLRVEEARKMFAQLCGAVAYTHLKHCAHRDLKLENILLDKNNNVKLCDFGFTREYEPRTLLETICGTTCYMAPEMLLHQKYSGEAVDVWSLGIILYTLIYGEMPFEEESELDSKLKITTEDPVYSEEADMPSTCQDLLKSLLSKDPKNRPTLDEILSHPFLEEHGQYQKEILSEKTPKVFSTKAEKKVLRNLRSAHVDLEALAESIVKSKCDSLAGFWALSLEKERRRESKRSHNRASLSISKYSRSSKSKAVEKSLRINPSDANSHQGRDSFSEASPKQSPRFSSPLPRSSAERRASSILQNESDAEPSQYQRRSRQNTSGSENMTDDYTTPHDISVTKKTDENVDENTTLDGSRERKLSNEYSPSTKSSMSTVLSKTKRTFIGSSHSPKKTKNSHSFKNIMLKILFPGGNKRSNRKSPHNSGDSESNNDNSQASSRNKYDTTRNNGFDSLEKSHLEDSTNTDEYLELPVGSRPNDMSRKGGGYHQRPISEISQASQLSVASQASSAPSQISQGGKSSSKRPDYNRRSTSSSLSSLVSRSRREHSKTSSTSSASLNSSPRGNRRAQSPGSPIPGFVVSRHRRHVSGPRGRFNESAVFSSSPYKTRHLRKRSPFPHNSSSQTGSLVRDKKRGSKGSVIEEGDEGEQDEDVDYDEETEDDNYNDRGRTF